MSSSLRGGDEAIQSFFAFRIASLALAMIAGIDAVPYFSPTLNGGSPLLAGTVSSAIASIIATIT